MSQIQWVPGGRPTPDSFAQGEFERRVGEFLARHGARTAAPLPRERLDRTRRWGRVAAGPVGANGGLLPRLQDLTQINPRRIDRTGIAA